MKKFSKILVFSVLAVLLMTGSAMAITLDYFTGVPGDSVYNDTNAEYVYLTDLTVPESAPMIELSSSILSIYNHDYQVGIFEYDFNTNTLADLIVLDTYQNVTSSSVIFDSNTGIVTSLLDSQLMGTTFGFFLQFYTGVGTGILSNEVYFSDPNVPLNYGGDQFSIFYDPAGLASASYAEVALGLGSTGSQGHALVSVDDVAPISEPATMLLLGSCLIALVGISRKRFIKRG